MVRFGFACFVAFLLVDSPIFHYRCVPVEWDSDVSAISCASSQSFGELGLREACLIHGSWRFHFARVLIAVGSIFLKWTPIGGI